MFQLDLIVPVNDEPASCALRLGAAAAAKRKTFLPIGALSAKADDGCEAQLTTRRQPRFPQCPFSKPKRAHLPLIRLIHGMVHIGWYRRLPVHGLPDHFVVMTDRVGEQRAALQRNEAVP